MRTYEDGMVLLSKLSVEENKAQVGWFRHLTLVFATLLGVLAGLHTAVHDSRLSRLCYGSAALLLSLALLCCFVLLYIYSAWSAGRAKETYRSELNSAIKEGRDIRPCGVVVPKWCAALQIVCYTASALSLLLLGVYSFLGW